jgi:hypothetical protein
MHLHLLGHLSALIGCDEMTGVRTVECGKHLWCVWTLPRAIRPPTALFGDGTYRRMMVKFKGSLNLVSGISRLNERGCVTDLQ